MHIPDGFLDTKTVLTAYALSGAGMAYAVKKAKETLNDRMVPRMGVMAAFIFAAQMVNFPVAGGTSGHLIGAALAAITLGPWAATLIMSTVLIIQCFFFLDGGVTALGGNILLMGIAAPWAAYGIYKLLAGSAPTRMRTLSAGFVAALASTVVASVVCTLLLAASGTVPLNVVLPAMVGWHTLIGFGEGIITTVVLSYLTQVKAELITQTESA